MVDFVKTSMGKCFYRDCNFVAAAGIGLLIGNLAGLAVLIALTV